MARNPGKAILKQFETDLRVLCEILTANEISLSGASNIETASYHLLEQEGTKQFISFTVSNIDIKIDSFRHIMPAAVTVEDRLFVDIIFKQEITGKRNVEDALGRVINNQVSFQIRGKKGNRNLISAWHFDRQPHPPADDSPCHPTYHFQFGGWGLKEVMDKIDGVLIVDAPRHFAPPMDPILAVDVLLSHFNGPKWHTIRNNENRYVTIVRRAQARLWKPYFDKISSDLSPVPGDEPARLLGLLPNVM